MKIREIVIYSIAVAAVVLFLTVPQYVLYHHGPNWPHVMETAAGFSALYLINIVVRSLWRRTVGMTKMAGHIQGVATACGSAAILAVDVYHLTANHTAGPRRFWNIAFLPFWAFGIFFGMREYRR